MAGMGELFKSDLAVDRAMLTLAGLLVMAGLQLVRGQVLAPAATLHWHAVATRHFLTPPDRGE